MGDGAERGGWYQERGGRVERGCPGLGREMGIGSREGIGLVTGSGSCVSAFSKGVFSHDIITK